MPVREAVQPQGVFPSSFGLQMYKHLVAMCLVQCAMYKLLSFIIKSIHFITHPFFMINLKLVLCRNKNWALALVRATGKISMSGNVIQ